jgi:hypothetical protein
MPDAPSCEDLAVIVAYFNPCGFASRRRNLHLALAALEQQGVPTFVAELTFGDRKLELPPGDRVLHLRAADVMWHKESLLNALVCALPEGYTKVAWLDADVIFDDPSWYSKSCIALEVFDLIQPYATAEHFGPAGTVVTTTQSLAARAADDRGYPFDFSIVQPGLAWAARRDFLETFPLLDRMIVGGADLLMALAAFGCRDHAYLRRLPHVMQSYYQSYEAGVRGRIDGRVGHTDSVLRHLWHGTVQNRRYVERLHVLRTYSFDPHLDVDLDRNGVLRWASDKKQLHQAVLAYFIGRLEDAA